MSGYSWTWARQLDAHFRIPSWANLFSTDPLAGTHDKIQWPFVLRPLKSCGNFGDPLHSQQGCLISSHPLFFFVLTLLSGSFFVFSNYAYLPTMSLHNCLSTLMASIQGGLHTHASTILQACTIFVLKLSSGCVWLLNLDFLTSVYL